MRMLFVCVVPIVVHLGVGAANLETPEGFAGTSHDSDGLGTSLNFLHSKVAELEAVLFLAVKDLRRTNVELAQSKNEVHTLRREHAELRDHLQNHGNVQFASFAEGKETAKSSVVSTEAQAHDAENTPSCLADLWKSNRSAASELDDLRKKIQMTNRNSISVTDHINATRKGKFIPNPLKFAGKILGKAFGFIKKIIVSFINNFVKLGTKFVGGALNSMCPKIKKAMKFKNTGSLISDEALDIATFTMPKAALSKKEVGLGAYFYPPAAMTQLANLAPCFRVSQTFDFKPVLPIPAASLPLNFMPRMIQLGFSLCVSSATGATNLGKLGIFIKGFGMEILSYDIPIKNFGGDCKIVSALIESDGGEESDGEGRERIKKTGFLRLKSIEVNHEHGLRILRESTGDEAHDWLDDLMQGADFGILAQESDNLTRDLDGVISPEEEEAPLQTSQPIFSLDTGKSNYFRLRISGDFQKGKLGLEFYLLVGLAKAVPLIKLRKYVHLVDIVKLFKSFLDAISCLSECGKKMIVAELTKAFTKGEGKSAGGKGKGRNPGKGKARNTGKGEGEGGEEEGGEEEGGEGKGGKGAKAADYAEEDT